MMFNKGQIYPVPDTEGRTKKYVYNWEYKKNKGKWNLKKKSHEWVIHNPCSCYPLSRPIQNESHGLSNTALALSNLIRLEPVWTSRLKNDY